MEALIKRSIVNWSTTLPGVLALICESAAWTDLLPEEYKKYLHAICLFLVTIGVIASKSQGVTNSSKPAAPIAVTAEQEAKPNPAAPIAAVLLCAFVLTAGCAGGPGVKMEPFTPDEVNVLVHAAVATYLMERNVTPRASAEAANYLYVVRSTVSTGKLDTATIREQVVDNVPDRWQPLAAATWVILLKRINLEQLIANGEHVKAREYIDAAIVGAYTALQNRSKT